MQLVETNKPRRVLALKKSTPDSALLIALFEETDNLKEISIKDVAAARRVLKNIACISGYLNKRWSN